MTLLILDQGIEGSNPSSPANLPHRDPVAGAPRRTPWLSRWLSRLLFGPARIAPTRADENRIAGEQLAAFFWLASVQIDRVLRHQRRLRVAHNELIVAIARQDMSPAEAKVVELLFPAGDRLN